MNKKEFFAAVNLYKRQPEIVQWKNDFLPKAIAASAKEILAHSTGNDEDAVAFANELASYTKKLDWLPDSEFAKLSSLIEHSAEELVEKYSGAFDEGVLEHGTKWKDHKYIRIENGRYIYPEDVKQNKKSIDPIKNIAQTVGEKIGTALANKVLGVSNNQTQTAAGAAINKAQADGAKRTANLQKSTYQKIQSAKDVAQQKIDEIEKKQYVKPIKEGLTNVLTGKVATKEDENNAPKTGLANLDLGKRVVEKKHDMTLAGDNQGQPTSLYVKNKYFADGVTKTANEFQKQINKADLDKKNLDELHSNMENLAKQNEIRKEKLSKAEAAAEVRKGDTSAQKAQAEGEAMQRWKRDQEATKRMDEDKERTINRVADLESGLVKEEFDGELRILKQALADANVDQKRIDEAKARNAEAVRAKDDNAKNQAQKEGEAMQAWKNAKAAAEVRKGDRSAEKAQSEGELQQLWKDYNNTEKINSSIDDAIEKFSNKFDIAANYKTKDVIGNNLSKEKYNAFMKSAVTYFLYTLHGMTDFKKAESNGKIPDVNEFVSSLDKMADDPKALYRKLLNDAGGIAIDIAKEYKFSELAKATKVRHSIEPLSKDEYYAAIAEYKRKKSMSPTYLEHHGILGQKWGIRRFQNPDGTLTSAGKKRYGDENQSAKQAQNRLNDVDQARAYNSRAVSDERILANKYENKALKAERKGKLEKAEKFRGKQSEHENKLKIAMENIKKGDRETEELLKRLKESGKFDVSIKDILRNTDRLSDVLKNTAVGAALGLTGGIYVNSYHFSDGTKYKVKDAKKQKNKMYDDDFSEEEKDRIRNMSRVKDSSFDKLIAKAQSNLAKNEGLLDQMGKKATAAIQTTRDQARANAAKNEAKRQEFKKEALSRAKNTGMYDMNFLEAVQNKDWYDNDQKMLSEYSKYLDNPEKYWVNRS